MRALRAILGLLVVVLGGWLVSVIFQGSGPAQPMREFTSSRQCMECHAEVFAEWESSWHAKSWVDPDVRALSNDFANTDCIDCHAPRPIFESGIGKRVLPRAARRSEGVDCIACHLLPEGGVAGTMDSSSAACRPVAKRELASPDFCGVCHNQHLTVEQWRASDYADQGISCVDCHMPLRDGDPNRGRDHRCLGGHDIDLVRSAVDFRARREGSALVVEVENIGAGHSFPTDERSRASDVFWRPRAAPGETPEPWRHLYRFRSPYRHEVDLEDTWLPAHATWTGRVEDPGAGPLEVAIYYKLTPYWLNPEQPDPDSEAQLMHRVEVGP
jgi:nitrate/TMAO reductase-like tetraheme cytochrome c subunit